MTTARAPRVAMLLSSPPGPRSGGPGTFVAGLLQALHRRGRFPVTLIAPDAHAGGPGRRGSQALLAISHFIALLRATPDVVHVHEHPSLLAAAVAYQLLRRPSARLVVTSHIDPVAPRAWWKRVVLGWLLSRCAYVTVMARHSIGRLALVAAPPPAADHVKVIPAAATVRVRDRNEPAVTAFRNEMGCAGGPVLLQISNCVYPAKVAGTVRLLEAFDKVRRRFPAAHLLVIGRGPLVNSVVEARDRLGLAASVTIPITFIEDLSIPLAVADVHCHISQQDMCPISILEAMHAGKPIVASRAGGIPELIDHEVTGLLVDDDPAHIAGAIIGLLDDPAKAATLGAAARHAASTHFTWERVAADCERLYAAAGHGLRTQTPAQVLHVAN